MGRFVLEILMTISPVFHCKKCYFLTHSRVSVEGPANALFSNCSWQCSGCGAMMNVSHMSFHGDGVFIMGDSDSFDILIAHVLEIGRRDSNSEILYIDESRIPPAFAWAKAIAKKYPERTFVLLSTIATLGLAITSLVDGRKQHSESMAIATELARLQMEQADRLATKSRSDSEDYHELASRVSNLLEQIRSGEIQSNLALQRLITEHNRSMAEIHQLVREAQQFDSKAKLHEIKLGATTRVQEDQRRLSDLLRRSGMPVGSRRRN